MCIIIDRMKSEHEHAQTILHSRGDGEDGPSTHGLERLSARSSRHGPVKQSATFLYRLPPYFIRAISDKNYFQWLCR